MNLPNSLTLTRIFLIPLLVVVLLTEFEGQLVLGIAKELVGAVIVGLAALTDLLDGYLARRRQQVTMLGELMDPLADKLLVTAALVSLVQMGLAAAGGAIVLAAECRDGLGLAEYTELLTSEASPAALLERIRSPGAVRYDQWGVQCQAMVQAKADVWLDPSRARRAGPVSTRAATSTRWGCCCTSC